MIFDFLDVRLACLSQTFRHLSNWTPSLEFLANSLVWYRGRTHYRSLKLDALYKYVFIVFHTGHLDFLLCTVFNWRKLTDTPPNCIFILSNALVTSQMERERYWNYCIDFCPRYETHNILHSYLTPSNLCLCEFRWCK